MVLGIQSFREKFKNYTDCYTVIGGTACDILLTEADLPFRATKDVDMILIMEDRNRKRTGEHVNEKDLKKHKYDVFRLLQAVTAGAKVESDGLVQESIHRYIDEISALDKSEIRLMQMGLPFDRDQGVELLKAIYL
ncbi:MAG: hypothetical protein Q4C65_04580 [Eubacteriales bacterium]|nr:hypothetical protein [Eubacteriales bacterium]